MKKKQNEARAGLAPQALIENDMGTIKTFIKTLSMKSMLIMLLFLIMVLGLVTFLASPFLLIWVGWGLAWRIGATGLVTTITTFTGWWLIYNTFYATKRAIKWQKEN